jgi:pSer/pThr/pTyr-binding forkhead associated (FHA) protein
MTFNEALIADMQAPAHQAFNILLKPISHPELGDICIEDSLFAIGRTEPPFASYRPDIVAGLSRRHARIFSEDGAVYVADLDSKNGTTVNDVNVREKPGSLRDGDEICFGAELSYRVRLGGRANTARRVAKLVNVTLSPVHSDLGLQPIVLTQLPFLIGKADDTFSRYKNEYPHQVNYISRRHAHIFLKGATSFVEDLGSKNGTFVGGKRLDAHAVPLEDGDLLGFGGSHFLYKVSLKKVLEVDETVTKVTAVVPSAAQDSGDPEKTTFVVSAASFLDIFCVDDALQQDDEVNPEGLKQSDDAKQETDRRRERGKFAILLSELTEAFAGSERTGMRRVFWSGTSLMAVLGMLAFVLYLWGAGERELKDLFATGEYARAATVANQYLERHPDNAEIKALAAEALFKASVPKWLTLLKAGDFDRASAALASMKQLSSNNAGVQSLVSALEWMADLDKFVMSRGGVDAPIRIYVDEEKIKVLLKQWNEDSQRHQRAFATISSYVPEFKDAYAEALSHLRKLQNDDSVYLAAIERLKTTISAELDRDTPEAMEAVLKEYSEKYPRLGGLDGVRQDLRQYIEVESEARARRLGRLVALLAKVRFSTPPFQAKFRALTSSDRFPPADVVQQYGVVSEAWRLGDAKQAFASLQRMGAGPWADAASRELQHKKTIVEQYTALQKARGANGYEERLLTFYGSLDPDQDAYLVLATEADVDLYKDKALARAQESLQRAETLWRQYRENGEIEGRERLKVGISNEFRTQAQLLSEAYENAQRGIRIYTQLKVARPAQWSKVQEEIKAEAELQRKSLLDLRYVLEPGLWKAKLALLGGRSDDERKSP